MTDMKVLLREAVTVDQVDPDFPAVVDRVRRRQRRRVAGRLSAGAVAIALIVGAMVTGQGFQRHDGGGSDAAIVVGQDDDQMPDESAFARLLASRGWLATADLDGWPVQPSEFLDGPPEPGIIVIGTLLEARPGAVTTSSCMGTPDCFAQTNVETVIRVDVVAPGAQAHPDELVVPWVTDQFSGTDQAPDQATSDLNARPFVDVAPIGARVLLFLEPGGGDPYEWRPVEPSGIVIEASDGVAVPQPDPDAADLTSSFDDYVAEMERLGAHP